MSGSEDIGYEVLRALRRILRKVSEHSRHLSHTTGLTVPQLLCLRAISRMEREDEAEITVAMVAKQVRLTNATVSRILDRLERAGFVKRERRAADRRKVCLELTPLGVERLKDLPLPLHEQFLRRVEQLEPQEREDLLLQLARIVEMMEAEDIDAAPVLTPEFDVKKSTPEH